ncbi:MAG: ferritin family protein [Polyangiaceae bacterium]|nr:ferritin family protein [Polyangiaceae bacterium]
MSTKTRGIDFSKLSLKDALDLAILVEEEAEERYVELAHQMEIHRTEEAAAFFRFMAINEKKHGSELSERRKKLFGDAPREVRRTMIFDIEAPDYDEARAQMSPHEALTVAMSSEKKAYEFFVAALPHLSDPEVRSLFEELRQEEIHHQELVAKELAKVPATKDALGDAFEDEPLAL